MSIHFPHLLFYLFNFFGIRVDMISHTNPTQVNFYSIFYISYSSYSGIFTFSLNLIKIHIYRFGFITCISC